MGYHAKTKRFLMPEERRAKRKLEKKEAKKKEKEEAARNAAISKEQQLSAADALKAEMLIYDSSAGTGDISARESTKEEMDVTTELPTIPQRGSGDEIRDDSGGSKER